jgi:hypothetical protein
MADSKQGATTFTGTTAEAASYDEDTKRVGLRFQRKNEGPVFIDFPSNQLGWLIVELVNARALVQGDGQPDQYPLHGGTTQIGLTMDGHIYLRFETKEGSPFSFALERDQARKVVDGVQQVLARTASAGPGSVQ